MIHLLYSLNLPSNPQYAGPLIGGGSVLKTGLSGKCVFATFSKNINYLTFIGCQSEIPFNSSQLLPTPPNSSQLLPTPYESEVLLPIRYQIFEDVQGMCLGVFYKKRVFYLGYLNGATSRGCLTATYHNILLQKQINILYFLRITL